MLEQTESNLKPRYYLKSTIEAYIGINVGASNSDILTAELVGRIENLHVQLHAEPVEVKGLPEGVEEQFKKEDIDKQMEEGYEISVTYIDLTTGQDYLFIRYENDGITYKLDTNEENGVYMASVYLGKVIAVLDNEEQVDLEYTLLEEDEDGNLTYRLREKPVDKSHLN